jgi:hypothetical protein
MPDAHDGMPVFIAVAEARSSRTAGDRLGVTSSAVSQALRRLETDGASRWRITGKLEGSGVASVSA